MWRKKHCHPERSSWFEQRSSYAVEGSLYPDAHVGNGESFSSGKSVEFPAAAGRQAARNDKCQPMLIGP